MKYIVILLVLLSSCYPPQIIYKMGSNYVSSDSIRVSLLDGYAISNGTKWFINLKINLENEKSDKICVGKFNIESFSRNSNISGVYYYSDFPETIDTVNRFFNKNLTYTFSSKNISDELLSEYAFMKNPKKNHELKVSFNILNSEKDSALEFVIIPAQARRIWRR